jgi:hypothetical protein
MGLFDQMGGGPTGNTGGPLASLFGGDPRQLMQLLSAGRVAGPNAMTPQFVQPGNPAGAPALNGAPMPAVSPPGPFPGHCSDSRRIGFASDDLPVPAVQAIHEVVET